MENQNQSEQYFKHMNNYQMFIPTPDRLIINHQLLDFQNNINDRVMVIYHSKDIDGLYSAYLAKLQFKNNNETNNIVFVGYDREENFTINVNGIDVLLEEFIKTQKIEKYIFVDITPSEKMLENFLTPNDSYLFTKQKLIIIDHHKSNIKRLLDNVNKKKELYKHIQSKNIFVENRSYGEPICNGCYQHIVFDEITNIEIIMDNCIDIDYDTDFNYSASYLLYKHYLQNNEKYKHLGTFTQIISDYDTYLFDENKFNRTPLFINYYLMNFGTKNRELLFNVFDSINIELKVNHDRNNKVYRKPYNIFRPQKNNGIISLLDNNYMEYLGQELYFNISNHYSKISKKIEISKDINYNNAVILISIPENSSYDYSLYNHIDNSDLRKPLAIYQFYIFVKEKSDGTFIPKLSIRNSRYCKGDRKNKLAHFDCSNFTNMINSKGGGHYGAAGVRISEKESITKNELIQLLEPAIEYANSYYDNIE